MRAPIGFRISNRRKSLKISQAALARLVGISPSYLNLIENNKRDVGGALLQRAQQGLAHRMPSGRGWSSGRVSRSRVSSM